MRDDPKKRGTMTDGTVQVNVGDEFDPQKVRSHKWDVSGRETTPEMSTEDYEREMLNRWGEGEG